MYGGGGGGDFSNPRVYLPVAWVEISAIKYEIGKATNNLSDMF